MICVRLHTDVINLLSAGVAEALDIAGAQFSDLIREGGWNLQDSLLYCKYRGKLCDERVSESRLDLSIPTDNLLYVLNWVPVL